MRKVRTMFTAICQPPCTENCSQGVETLLGPPQGRLSNASVLSSTHAYGSILVRDFLPSSPAETSVLIMASLVPQIDAHSVVFFPFSVGPCHFCAICKKCNNQLSFMESSMCKTTCLCLRGRRENPRRSQKAMHGVENKRKTQTRGDRGDTE